VPEFAAVESLVEWRDDDKSTEGGDHAVEEAHDVCLDKCFPEDSGEAQALGVCHVVQEVLVGRDGTRVDCDDDVGNTTRMPDGGSVHHPHRAIPYDSPHHPRLPGQQGHGTPVLPPDVAADNALDAGSNPAVLGAQQLHHSYTFPELLGPPPPSPRQSPNFPPPQYCYY